MADSIRLSINDALAGKTVQEVSDKWLPKVAIMVVAQAKRLCPVDTGNLRSSIAWEKRGDGVYVGTRVTYAIHIEYGSSTKAPQGFLRPALDDVMHRLPA